MIPSTPGLEPSSTRDYAPIATRMRQLPSENGRDARMQAVADAVWSAFGVDAGGNVSWVGFYLPEPGTDQLVLGPRRDKPACSPIGKHGACGRAMASGKALVVMEVSRLGDGYVACDPRDRSELVIPLMNESGECWGVFDADSQEGSAFYERDAYAMMLVLRAAKLTEGDVGVEVV